MKSPLFTFFFRYYVWTLFYRRFRKVWLDQNYYPNKSRSTLYYLNHNSWWDGIIPLLLNEFRFNQNASAVMDKKQINQHPFFKKIGAYSIDRDSPRKALNSLHYTIDLLNLKGSSVYLFPQGAIVPTCSSLQFEGGIGWLHDQCHDVDFVPIALYQHTYFSDKPELLIKTGKPIEISNALSRKAKVTLMEESLGNLLNAVRKESELENPYKDRLV